MFSHFGLAAAGLVIWIIYLITGMSGLAWVAFVLLIPVALLGFIMLRR
jgi:manganese efflux pump family protein